jgi:hypothetical protein
VSALVFLGLAAGLSAVGCLILWLRSRQPRSMDAHIRDFARELDALAPGSPLDRPPRTQPGERGTLPPPRGGVPPERPPGRRSGPRSG